VGAWIEEQSPGSLSQAECLQKKIALDAIEVKALLQQDDATNGTVSSQHILDSKRVDGGEGDHQ
jgi:hypothetical protein